MKKNLKGILALLLSIAMLFSACGLRDDITDYPPDDDPTPTSNAPVSPTGKTEPTEPGKKDDPSNPTPTDAGNTGNPTPTGNAGDPTPTNAGNPTPTEAGNTTDVVQTQSLKLTVNNSTGELTVSRRTIKQNERTFNSGWTLFVYLCGTDLESEYASATPDLQEMLDATASNRVRFIVETGGTKEWDNNLIAANKLQRYLIQNNEITLLEEQRIDNMGKSETLESFLKWGLENYASSYNGLIFWNHGGGSITGVCFDERYDNDSLDLTEIDRALNETIDIIGKKFDFIGFDACLMGTVETANVLATFADYMYGSEEVEPGNGWNYTAIGSFLAGNPNADALALGQKVADSFLKACRDEGEDDEVTFSIIDLSKIDNLLVTFNRFAKDLYEAGEDTSKRAEIVRAIGGVDDFGGNNRTEGYTNMVDLGGIIKACASYSKNANAAVIALSDAVVYSVTGSIHKGVSGLSTYYPISVQGSSELSFFGKVCISPYYLSFVDMLGRIGASGDMYSDYDNDTWFDDDGEWFWGDGWDYYDDDYWSYIDDYDTTGESPYITFDTEPSFEDGYYYFSLDENGLNNTADVYGIVYVKSEDGEDLIEYGETYDIDADWENGIFFDNFYGLWVSLPDGQNLATYIVADNGDSVIYTSPVMLNGRETNLRLKLTDDRIVIEGAWDGINSESGASARDIIKLKKGDRIVPLYYSISLVDDYEQEDGYGYYGEEYIFDGEPEVYYDMMYPGEYLYAFCIDDIYGDYYMTDFETFYITEDGEVEY